jgi:hypothetical protein
MTSNLLLLFASFGVISTVFVARVIILDVIRINKVRPEANRFDINQVKINDLPKFNPVKKMYKGSLKNDLV